MTIEWSFWGHLEGPYFRKPADYKGFLVKMGQNRVPADLERVIWGHFWSFFGHFGV
jgi:hypothetical protein